MAITNFISTKWSSLVELAAQEQSIMGTISNGQYQADAVGASAVKTARVGAITIGDYTNDTDMTLQTLSDTAMTITMNQKKYFNFSVDDVAKAQSSGDFGGAAMAQAGQTLALEADKYALGLYASVDSANKIGAVGTSTAITTANIEATIYNLKEILDGQNAGPARFLVVPSWFMTKLALKSIGRNIPVAESIFASGNVLNYAGFTIVESNSISKVGTGSDEYQIMAFSDRTLPLVASVQNVETLRNTARFGDIVRGLYVFGATVAHPKELAVLSATKGVES